MEMNFLLVNYLRACTEAKLNLLRLTMISFVLIVADFYSTLRYVVNLFLHVICSSLEYYENQISRKIVAPKLTLLKTKYSANDDDHRVLIQTQNKLSRFLPKKVDDHDKKLSLRDVKGVMENLVLENETTMFEEVEEVSLEEVREAFDLFDQNKDGFIDAGEVQRVLCELGFMEASKAECEAMIRNFDKDRDGRIDFEEFIEIIVADTFG